jgi:hypothetical protein
MIHGQPYEGFQKIPLKPIPITHHRDLKSLKLQNLCCFHFHAQDYVAYNEIFAQASLEKGHAQRQSIGSLCFLGHR